MIHLVRVSDLVGRQYLTADDDAGGGGGDDIIAPVGGDAVAAVCGDAVVQVSKVGRDYGIEDKDCILLRMLLLLVSYYYC